MKGYGIVGQTAWFMFGTWAGASSEQLLEVIYWGEFRVRSTIDDGTNLPFMLVLFLPMSAFLSATFAAWLGIRGRRKVVPAVPWAIPLVAGSLFLPLCSAMIRVLCVVGRPGQGAVIGTLVMILLFGIPVVFAEICLRTSRCHVHNHPEPEPEAAA